jgi:hypothetical protein
MEWTSTYIRVWFFSRKNIPADITNGNPTPSGWGMPMANFDSAHGNCDIDANFPAQTIVSIFSINPTPSKLNCSSQFTVKLILYSQYFDTTFCGNNAGGEAWSSWSDCPAMTGYSTCEEYVAKTPHAFDDAYWLVNSVKVYQ